MLQNFVERYDVREKKDFCFRNERKRSFSFNFKDDRREEPTFDNACTSSLESVGILRVWHLWWAKKFGLPGTCSSYLQTRADNGLQRTTSATRPWWPRGGHTGSDEGARGAYEGTRSRCSTLHPERSLLLKWDRISFLDSTISLIRTYVLLNRFSFGISV